MKRHTHNVYINLSGGVDSTYYLWRFLRENPDSKVLVHHCLLNEARKEVEKTATDKIINYLRTQGIENFTYTESRFTRKGIHGNLMDIDIIGFMSSLVLKNKIKYPDIKTIILPYCYEETPIIRKHFADNISLKNMDTKNRTKRFIDVIELMSRRKYNFIIPYIKKTKQEMIAEMPKELFELTWYCRAPKEGKPCMKCFNCKRVNNLNKK
jgi:7-cyano-7-deazaguanine synthase in queuosine biosynthesis